MSETFLHIHQVDVIEPNRLRIGFNDGVIKEVDLAAELHGEVFEPLQDDILFAQAAINPETGTIEWPNGADFAPEFLYAAGREIKRIA